MKGSHRARAAILLGTVARGAAAVSLVQLPGAVLDSWIRRGAGIPFRLWAAVGVALALWLLASPRPERDYLVIEGEGLFLPIGGHRDCRRGRGCVDYGIGPSGLRLLSPDLFVVYFKRDDLEEEDVNSRVLALRQGGFASLLYVLNVEGVLDAVRISVRLRFRPPVDPARLRSRLDEIRAACAGKRLLLVTALDRTEEGLLRAWFAANPGVERYDAAGASAWTEAPKIPSDGHWTAGGTETVAALLEPAVRRALSGTGGEPR